MTRRYPNADSLRRALLDRLRTQSLQSGVPINTLLTKVLMERLLARLFAREDAPWRRERYPELAAQARVRALDLDAAFKLVSDYWSSVIR
ncbi:MAG: hypothetical protein NTV21_17995 [Planctomycetota bacterium]|nr:hypothetical protein [Planctomycetota bacterium]